MAVLRRESVSLRNANLSVAAHASVYPREWGGFSGVSIYIKLFIVALLDVITILVDGHFASSFRICEPGLT
jgi:hypothetical protein